VQFPHRKSTEDRIAHDAKTSIATLRPARSYRIAMDAAWLKEELDKPGRSQSALARFMGLDPSAINRMCSGSRQIKAAEADQIRSYLLATSRGDAPPSNGVTLARTVQVVGIVEAGAWREEDPLGAKLGSVPAVGSQGAGDGVFALKVAGNSMNRYYEDGSFVIVQPWHGGPMPVGKRVVVRRARRDGLYEMTVKELVQGSNGLELWPRSDDPRHQTPVPFEGDEAITVELVGRVIAKVSYED
jgi:phage repressor protein C with HTH and peptisase S24 domain